MKKSLVASVLTFVLLFYVASAFASELTTENVALIQAQTLYGIPLGTSSDNRLVVRSIYCLSNNPDTKLADWVAYRVDSETMKAGTRTKRTWRADPALPADETLEPADYKGAHAALHTDRGHQAPLASFKGTNSWHQTNYLSNITPQRSDLNQGPWKRLEDKVRELAANETIYVMTGPLYERDMEALPGADEPHKVPSGYWKIVAIQKDGELPLLVTAYIFDQNTSRRSKMSEHVVTVDEIEERSELDFFWKLPDDVEAKLESSH